MASWLLQLCRGLALLCVTVYRLSESLANHRTPPTTSPSSSRPYCCFSVWKMHLRDLLLELALDLELLLSMQQLKKKKQSISRMQIRTLCIQSVNEQKFDA